MADFDLLSSYFKLPVISNLSGLQKHHKADCVGIVLTIRQDKGEFIKLFDLLNLRVRRLHIRFLMYCHGYRYIASYNVFPSLERPVVTFQNDSAAANYVIHHVLPSPGTTISCRFKTVISVIAGCHFAVAGETLLFRSRL